MEKQRSAFNLFFLEYWAWANICFTLTTKTNESSGRNLLDQQEQKKWSLDFSNFRLFNAPVFRAHIWITRKRRTLSSRAVYARFKSIHRHKPIQGIWRTNRNYFVSIWSALSLNRRIANFLLRTSAGFSNPTLMSRSIRIIGRSLYREFQWMRNRNVSLSSRAAVIQAWKIKKSQNTQRPKSHNASWTQHAERQMLNV